MVVAVYAQTRVWLLWATVKMCIRDSDEDALLTYDYDDDDRYSEDEEE